MPKQPIHPVVCLKCHRHDLLIKPLNDYRTEPTCKYCGGDLNCVNAMNIKPVVYCKYSCMPHPHRRGSKYCIYNKDGTRRKDGEYVDYDVENPYYD